MSSESGAGRRKRMTAAVSIFNRLSGVSASMRSRGSSMLSKFQREMMGVQESDTVRCREWLFCVLELLLSFSWNCLSAREKSEKSFEMRGITPREETITTLLVIGLASFTNLIVGQLMDSLTGYYLMALFNIMLHFALASLFLVSEIVHETSSEDVYVYAMDQVGVGKASAFIIHYTFIFGLLNLCGDFLFSVVQDTAPSSELLSAIAFCFNGTALFLYAYTLRPKPRISVQPPPDAAIKIWGVLFTALRNKRKFGSRIKRQDWLDFAENKYDKVQIARTRRIFRLFLMILPNTAFLLFTTYQGIIFKEFFDALKLAGPNVPNWKKWLLPTSTLLMIIGMEYVVLPLLRTCGCKFNFLRRFLLGYMSMLFAVSVAAIVTTATEKMPIRPGSGTFRVYNTMEGNFSLDSMQEDFTKLQVVLLQRETFQANFETSEQHLFRLAVTFVTTIGDDVVGKNTNYTQLFSVAPEEVLQYVAIAPSTVVRVPGLLPIKQGPPGTNDGHKPRCFIVSLIGERTMSVYVINDKTEKREAFDIGPGNVVVFQVEEGNYTLQYTSSISRKTTSMLETGGLYGIYLYLGLNDYEMDVDKIVPGNTLSALLGLAVVVPMGIARVFGQVSLNAFVYATAPDGLKGLAYGFYLLCIHFAAWFLFVGFHTWHHYITPNIILWYALLALVSFFFCLVPLIKYRNHYAM